jgi:1-acyl-sn-glycerol-3-phosphate acyltransferase
VGILFILAFYFLIAGPIGYTAFAMLLLVPVRDRNRRARRLQNTMKFWISFMHGMARRLRVLDFHPNYLEGQLPETPCVIVANHPSYVDVTALIATIPHVCSVVKPALFRRLWTRPLLKQAAHFEGVDHDRESLERMIAEAIDRLSRGFHVIVFPEGTRSPRHGLHPFGRSAFEIAVRAKVPVLPIVIECKPRWLTKDHSFFSPPQETPRLRIKALKTVDPSAMHLSSRSLGKVVRAAIEEHLAALEAGDVEDRIKPLAVFHG